VWSVILISSATATSVPWWVIYHFPLSHGTIISVLTFSLRLAHLQIFGHLFGHQQKINAVQVRSAKPTEERAVVWMQVAAGVLEGWCRAQHGLRKGKMLCQAPVDP